MYVYKFSLLGVLIVLLERRGSDIGEGFGGRGDNIGGGFEVEFEFEVTNFVGFVEE